MNRVAILMTSYYPDNAGGRARYSAALECIKSWFDHLKYDGELKLYIADDGSEIDCKWDTRQERKGVGASLNTGFKAAFEESDLVMYIVDDWKLLHDLDINPWAKLLQRYDNIGMVRLGPPHPRLTGRVTMFEDGWGLILDRYGFAYGMRPAIYHKRFFEAYGWFKEEINCIDCEQIYNVNFCNSDGPEIVYALPDYWEHIYTLDMGYLEPCAN